MGKTRADRPPPGVNERRRFGKRFGVTHPIEVAGRTGGFAAQTINVSRTGVLLWVCDERFLPLSESANMVLFTERVAEEFGEGLEVRLSQDIAIEAEVVRVTRREERDEGTVLIACRYARPLLAEEWDRLGFEQLPPDDIEQEMSDVLGPEHMQHADRRRARRVPHADPVEIHSDYAAYRAQVINLSAVGVLLEMTDPAFAAPNGADRLLVCTRRLGTQFGRGMRVRFLETDLTVDAAIVRVGEKKASEGAAILVGCRFEPPLDPETCRTLGIEPMRRAPTPMPDAPRPAAEPAAEPESGPDSDVRDVLRRAVEKGASDVHIKAGSPARVRVAGTITNLDKQVLEPVDTHAMALDLMDDRRARRYEERGHVAFARTVTGVGRFRVNVVRQQDHAALAVRCLPEHPPSLQELGAGADLRALTALPSGLVLLAGRAGTGRSSLLAAMVDEINRTRACHIVTLEDPVEFVYRELAAHITQRDLGLDGITMADGMRQALQLDADVVAASSLADARALSAALEAAESGRLVLAVSDGGTARRAVERLAQLVHAPRLATLLRAVSVQRLVHDEDGGTRLEVAVQRLDEAAGTALRSGQLPSW